MKLKIGLGQIRLEVGVDEKTMDANIGRMRSYYEKAKNQKCDVVIFPELAVTGYSPEDLLLRVDSQIAFTQKINEFRDEILNESGGPTIIFGAPRVVSRNDDGNFPQKIATASTLEIGDFALANAALIIDPNSKLSNEVYKMHLPNWGIFDEARVFNHACEVGPTFEVAGVVCGVVICRDIWIESSVADLAKAGAKIIFVPNASPYANSRAGEREKIINAYATKYGVAIVYVNMVEGCDELVFDGGSFVIDGAGTMQCETKRFVEDFTCVDVALDGENIDKKSREGAPLRQVDMSGRLGQDVFDPEEAYQAIVLGTREYINAIDDNAKVCVGLSGGIDSALVATIAVDAIGHKRVHGVLMPSKFTSNRSIDDAIKLSETLGITYTTISIEKLHESATEEFSLDSLEPIISENIQSRLRGLTLMMVSNSKHYLVLATSNKSESAVGYFTLYGDSVGAWAPIKDVYKTQVYELCEWRNTCNIFDIVNPIHESILKREPTAELRDNQTDAQALYPYDVLDGILELFIDHEFSYSSIVERGFEPESISRVISLVKASEFKRKQSPVGPRLTRKNFGRGRRVPISAHW